MLDASRKIILDSIQAGTEGKRISYIESKSISWANTDLYLIGVVQRGTPDIKVFIAKASENKFYSFFTLKGIVQDADSNPTSDTSYLDYP